MHDLGRWLALTSILGWIAACGPTEVTIDGHLDFPIINGEPVAEDEHRAVVYLSIPGAACTGTLISDRVVLTAAHCIDGVDAEDVYVYFGNNSSSGYQRYLASEALAHPFYRRQPIVNDIGLVRLAQPAPADVVPVPHLPASLEITNSDVGQPVEFVGFGQTETGGSGVKLKVMGEVLWICTSSGGCYFGGQVWGSRYTLCFDQAEGGTCSGDSGGPALFERDGQVYVAGITSYGPPNTCYSYGCSTKVDEFQNFIEDFLGAPSGTPCDEHAECESTQCHDGVCCDVSCLGTCEACDLQGLEGICSPIQGAIPCPDNNICDGEEYCEDGTCRAGEPLACSDQVQCTRDLCDPQLGCVFQPSSLDCFDDNPCTEDRCDASLGCFHENLPDGRECDLDSHCLAGQCVPDPVEDCGCVFGVSPAGGLGLLALAGLLAVFRRRRPV